MKNLIPLSLICILCCFGCHKAVQTDGTFSFAIDSIKNLVVTNKDSAYMHLHGRLINGDPSGQPITLKISGLPQGVTVNPDSVTFRLNYDMNFKFKALNAVPGTYPLQVTEYNNTIGTRTHTFSLTVLAEPDCAEKMTGNYMRDNGYIPFDSFYLEMVAVQGIPHRLAMKHFFIRSSATVYADLNCDDSSLTIPLQHIGDTTVWGHGGFTIKNRLIGFYQYTIIGHDTTIGNIVYRAY